VRARPTAMRGVARARGAGAARMRGPRPRPAQRARPSSAGSHNAWRTVPGARRRCCSASQRWHGGATSTGERRAARRRSGRRCFGRDGGAVSEAVATAALSRVRAAHCLDSGLKSRASRAARGSHAATARCRAGPAWRAASDRWGALVSDF
jgi:hypothetical protein